MATIQNSQTERSNLIGKYNRVHERYIEPGVTHSSQGKMTQEKLSELDKLKNELKEMRVEKAQLIRDNKFNPGFFKTEDVFSWGSERYLEKKIEELEKKEKGKAQLKNEWEMMARAMPLFVKQHEEAKREKPNNETILSILKDRFFHHRR